MIAALCLLGGAALAVFIWDHTSQTVGRKFFCGNLLSREDVTSAGIDLSDYSLTEQSSPDDFKIQQLCKIYSPARATTVPAFSLKYEEAGQTWPYGANSYYDPLQYTSQFPLGNGINGWVGNGWASVRLPDSCTPKTRIKNGPLEVTVNFGGDQAKRWSNEETRKRMSTVLMKSAIGVTRSLGCSTKDFTAPNIPPEPHQGKASRTSTCELPGFSPFREDAQVQNFPEVTSGDDYRVWSCALRPDNDTPGAFTAFSITKNDQLINDYEKRNPASHPASTPGQGLGSIADQSPILLTECSGSKTLFRMMTYTSKQYPDNYRLAAKSLLPDKEMFEQFVLAATKKMGCASS
ncbi:hypothetical protein [Streptomyces sp. NPDC051173]|uniref:hypothetical protein n=1 Tax=Streptomyces sp. NPDC051173 TaxID=3155164 RepID=UPI00344B71B0